MLIALDDWGKPNDGYPRKISRFFRFSPSSVQLTFNPLCALLTATVAIFRAGYRLDVRSRVSANKAPMAAVAMRY
jgi:hypothetical protein